jgi:hypothetical protein
MQHLGEINGRQVLYLKVDGNENWFDELPTENWLVLPIGDDQNIQAYFKLADKCIDKKVVYVCTLGQCCELIHDIFDEEIVGKKISNGESVESEDEFENSPMTTWDYNFASGFWFAVTSAYDGDKLIDKVVCIDYTSGVKNFLIELLNKFHQEWLPSDDAVQLPKYDN